MADWNTLVRLRASQKLSVSYITSFNCDTIGTYLRQIVLHPLMHACVYVGEWPLVINTRTAFTAGNHSVSITAADSIGLSAQSIVPFTLLDTTRTNRELMLIDYHCIHSYNSYTIVKISKIYFHDFERADAL